MAAVRGRAFGVSATAEVLGAGVASAAPRGTPTGTGAARLGVMRAQARAAAWRGRFTGGATSAHPWPTRER